MKNEVLEVAYGVDGIRAWLATESKVARHCNRNPIGKYHALGEFILSHGVECVPKPLPIHVRRGMLKQCFYNAAKLVMSKAGDGLCYVEGWAAGVIPVHHAWAIEPDGNVIDPTWEDPDDGFYFGVPILTSYVREIWKRKDDNCSMIDRWQEHWPMLMNDGEGAIDFALRDKLKHKKGIQR